MPRAWWQKTVTTLGRIPCRHNQKNLGNAYIIEVTEAETETLRALNLRPLRRAP